MNDQPSWLSAPLGAADVNPDDLDDDDFRARLGGVPVERLGEPGATPAGTIESLPPPPYSDDTGTVTDPWAAPAPATSAWDDPGPARRVDTFGALAADPEPTPEPEPPAPAPPMAPGVASGLRTDVWADLIDATGPAPEPDGLDDLFTAASATIDPAPAPAFAPEPAPAAPGANESPAAAAPDDAWEAPAPRVSATPPAPQPDLAADTAAVATEPPTLSVDETTAGDATNGAAPDDGFDETAAVGRDAGGDASDVDPLGLEDLFDDDPDEDAIVHGAAATTASPERSHVRWEAGVDRYEDPQIVYAAERITAGVSGIPEITDVTRNFVLTRDASLDVEQRAQLEEIIEPHLPYMQVQMSPGDYPAILDLVYDELLGLGPLGAAWRADEVTEILVDGWDRVIVEVDGELLGTDIRFRSNEQAQSIARALSQSVSGRQLSPATPLVTAKLDRARVNFADGVVVPDLGLAISIRKFNPQLSMEGLLRMGALTPGMRDIIWAVVRARGTVLVSGATGVGKTTLLSAAAEAIPYNDRIITIEDAREIALGDRLSWVPMQTKEKASGDDTALIDQAELLKNSLRQRPDRLVIGEVRDGRTASVMLEAANTGHEGTMTTLHANSASDALNSRIVRAVRRYEDSPPEVVREEVAEAFDLVVHGLRRRGRRFVAEICEVSPAYMVDGRIEPRVLWRAHIDVDREVHFEHVNGLDPDGRIALRLSELGVDPSQFDPVAD